MNKELLNQSLWRRGWQDTTAGWTNWRFLVFEVVVGGVFGGVFEWYWGVAAIVIGMICVWIGATVYAPVQQRNEARALLRGKDNPIVLRNRDELIRAIVDVRQTSGKFLMAQEQLDNLGLEGDNFERIDAKDKRDAVYAKYETAMQKLEAEQMVAGKPFESILSDLIGFISTQVFVKGAKPTIIGGDPNQFHIRTALEIFGRIAGRIGKVVSKIDELTGQDSDTEDSQNQ
jgi:hypothetical protein